MEGKTGREKGRMERWTEGRRGGSRKGCKGEGGKEKRKEGVREEEGGREDAGGWRGGKEGRRDSEMTKKIPGWSTEEGQHLKGGGGDRSREDIRGNSS